MRSSVVARSLVCPSTTKMDSTQRVPSHESTISSNARHLLRLDRIRSRRGPPAMPAANSLASLHPRGGGSRHVVRRSIPCIVVVVVVVDPTIIERYSRS